MSARAEVPSVKYVVTLVGRVGVHDDAGEELADADEMLEQHFDQVMDELDRLHASDPSIELAGRDVALSVMVEATNPLLAVESASGVIRSAVHAAGGATPDWPGAQDDKAWSVQLVGVRSDQVVPVPA